MRRLIAAGLLTLVTGCGDGSGGTIGAVADEALLSEAAVNEPPSENLDSFENRALWIDVYASYAARCITASQEKGQDKERAVFNECYDWHSAVHAHWAVFRADLKGGGVRLVDDAKAVDERFTTASLAKIKADLEAPADYEMPYGRAWFLRLASEHEIWGKARGIADPQRLRSLANFVAATLMTYYETHEPSPKNENYLNDSWSMAQLLAWFRQTEDAAQEGKVKELVQKHFVDKPMTWADSTDANPDSFFSTYWNWVYTIATAYDAARAIEIVAPDALPVEALTPIAAPADAATNDVHHLGVNWSRAWGIKALARHVIALRGQADPMARRLVAAYSEHVRAGRARHDKYKENYYAYSHWVPQFGVYGITD